MIKLVNDDCIKEMKNIKDKSINLILTDLPYGETRSKWDKILDFDKMWEQYFRVITDNGAIVLFGNEPFSSMLRQSQPEYYRYDWKWIKNRATGFANCNYRPMRSYEDILVFSKANASAGGKSNPMIYNPQGLVEVNKTKKISILPRGTTLGFVMHANEEEDDKFLQSKEELLNRIRVCLAGRAAEEVFFGDVTTGAANDLEKANNIANAMVCEYALVEELGLSTYNMNNPMTILKIQKHVDKILKACYDDVIRMVIDNKNKMADFAGILREREEMTGEEINEILYPETAEAE